jgi:hypothetical protein
MKNKVCLLFVVLVLAGCATTDEENLYAESLAQAKTILKSNRSVEMYEKYYHKPNHKAFVQSKVNGTSAYATFNTSTEFAIESALERCNDMLRKKYKEITDKVSCEVVNIDNKWITK